MRDGRRRLFAVVGALILVAALILVDVMVTSSHSTTASPTINPTVSGPGASSPASTIATGPVSVTAPRARSKIKHIVFVLLENHSFDSLFGTYPGADGATMATIAGHGVVPLLHAPSFFWHDIYHEQPDALASIDKGAMNGFSRPDGGNLNGDMMAYYQYQKSDIPDLWRYAQNFVLGDHMFSAVSGSTFPNHLYSVAAQSGGIFTNVQRWTTGWGCDSGSGAFVLARDAKTGKTVGASPCVGFTSLADVMTKAHLSWSYYADPAPHLGYIWSTLDAFKSVRDTSLWHTNVKDQLTFQGDARAGHLPAFSWLTPQYHESAHPPFGICEGQNWFVQNMNALMQGPDWSSTAVYLVFDDYGGFYDHVAPPVSDPLGFGPRVPMLLISPYAKHGYVSHTTYSYASVLRTFEEIKGLAPMTDGDARAKDTFDSFDFTQKPQAPLVLKPAACATEPGQAQYAQYLPAALTQALTYSLGLTMKQIVALHAHETIAQIAAARHVSVANLATAMQDAVANWANSAQLHDLLSRPQSGDVQNAYKIKIAAFINRAAGTRLTPLVTTDVGMAVLPHGASRTRASSMTRAGVARVSTPDSGAVVKTPSVAFPHVPTTHRKLLPGPNLD